MLEHLIFKRTANHSAGEFSQTVQRFGGSENAFGSSWTESASPALW
ncbi:hypothetical protein [Bradyrhizobium canariense]